jgi:succinate dehydrogenase/fumarate reductase flavoprotein subunit
MTALDRDGTNVDLLVVGGGIAGMAAAARAAQDGATVAVVEKQGILGGSGLYASYLWTAATTEAMRELNPECDAAISVVPVSDTDDAVAWISDLGVELGRTVRILGFGKGRTLDTAGLISACAQIVRSGAGNRIHLKTVCVELLLEEHTVIGARIRADDGKEQEVLAKTVLLATGGFAGSAGLRERFIGSGCRDAVARVNPGSVGDGFQLGRAAGASHGLSGAGFYGHLMPSHVPIREPSEFHDYTFFHSEHSLLFNVSGKRFCDETLGDHLSAQSLAAEPEARALMISDARVHEQWMLRPYVSTSESVDKFALAYRHGARCAVAETVDELEYIPPEWGYPGDVVLQGVYAANSPTGGRNKPARSNDAAPLVDPPYYLIEVIPAMTFPYVGLMTDSMSQVLDDAGKPVEGLLAAGADAGGLYYRNYAGGLMPAVCFGLRAGCAAALRANGKSVTLEPLGS